jgi:hypothetical protein
MQKRTFQSAVPGAVQVKLDILVSVYPEMPAFALARRVFAWF